MKIPIYAVFPAHLCIRRGGPKCFGAHARQWAFRPGVHKNRHHFQRLDAERRRKRGNAFRAAQILHSGFQTLHLLGRERAGAHLSPTRSIPAADYSNLFLAHGKQETAAELATPWSRVSCHAPGSEPQKCGRENPPLVRNRDMPIVSAGRAGQPLPFEVVLTL